MYACVKERGWKEGRREGGRDVGREGRREGGRGVGREGGREEGREPAQRGRNSGPYVFVPLFSFSGLKGAPFCDVTDG